MKSHIKNTVTILLSVTALLLFLYIGGCTVNGNDTGADTDIIEETISHNEVSADKAEENTKTGDTDEKHAAASENTVSAGQISEKEDPVPSTVNIHGVEYDRNETFLDLSDCTPEEIPEIAELIRDMPKLEKINLMDEEDSSLLGLSDVKLLTQAAPDAEFIYRFDLFGRSVSLSANVVRYRKKDIGNEGEESIRQALSVLNKCSCFVLDDCGIDDDVMAGINDDFPDIKVVWRVHVGNKSALTDDTVIRMTHGIDDTMTGPLKYCTEAVYVDLGHDRGISDISFLSNMPHLECLILSSSTVKDLSPLKKCHALTWLELVYCDKVTDISDIAGINSIKYLNISFTKVHDISPLMDMKLDRLCCIGNGISKETIEEYEEKNPDCMTSFSGTPWGYAWRYDDYGYHFFSYYARMREVFRYETTSPGGFKFPEYEEPVDPDEEPEETDEADDQEDAEGTEEGSDDTEKKEETEKSEETEKPEENREPDKTEDTADTAGEGLS